LIGERRYHKNTNEIQKTNRDYFGKLYSNKVENLEEIDKFLDSYDLPKLNQEDINLLNRSITNYEIEAVTESPNKENTRPLQKKQHSVPEVFHNVEGKKCYQTHCMKAVLPCYQSHKKIQQKRKWYTSIFDEHRGKNSQ
jgi:hypothetical protein